jgi:formate hydrogenlyase subunit 3/multisubunit Na+/H+ antiporter MnhD subunit
MIVAMLACIALLLGLACAAAFVAQSPLGRSIAYGGSLATASASLLIALFSLAAAPSTVTLPIGLPWTGAHFRLDPLSAFYLVVVGLGSIGASLYALGYG